MSQDSFANVGALRLTSEVFVVAEDHVLMHHRAEDEEHYPGMLMAPGGRLEPDDDAVQAAIREVAEETGVRLSVEQLKLKAVALHYHPKWQKTWLVFIFLATLPTLQTELVHSDEGQAEWIKISDVEQADNVPGPDRYYLQHVLHDEPGVLYTNLQIVDGEVAKVISQTRLSQKNVERV